jgi:hypothetical protein
VAAAAFQAALVSTAPTGKAPAAGVHAGLFALGSDPFRCGEERVLEDPRRPGGLPHKLCSIPTRDLTAADYQALAEFRYQIRRFLRYSEQAARRGGLKPAQHQLLSAIKAHDGQPTVGELAERMQLRHHSTVGLIDRLVQGGLVRRSARKATGARSASG